MTNPWPDSIRYMGIGSPVAANYEFKNLHCSDYDYTFVLEDVANIAFKNCEIKGGGFCIKGNTYLCIDECVIYKTSAHNGQSLILVHDCDSLIVVESVIADSTTDSEYDNIYFQSVDPDDRIVRFLNCEHYDADGFSLYWDADPSAAFEWKNSIIKREASGLVARLASSIDEDYECLFIYGGGLNTPIYRDLSLSISGFRTAIGNDQFWDYIPSQSNPSDTMCFGGRVPTSHFELLERRHTCNWASIGLTQHEIPNVPERFARLVDADSLLTVLPWIWSPGDTILYILSEINDYHEIADYLASDPQLTVYVLVPQFGYPQIPEPIDDLTIIRHASGDLELFWSPILLDIIGQPLIIPVEYMVQSSSNPYAVDDWQTCFQTSGCRIVFSCSVFPERAFFRVVVKTAEVVP